MNYHCRRCGELLKEFDERGEHRKKDGGGFSSKDMARDAGMSERQAKTAVRVANTIELLPCRVRIFKGE